MTKFLLAALSLIVSFAALADSTYTVRKGDTLLKIVDRELGLTDKKDPRRYQWAQRIRAKNPTLAKTDVLEPGDTITLPDFPGQAEEKPKKQSAEVAVPAAAPVVAKEPVAAPAPPAEPAHEVAAPVAPPPVPEHAPDHGHAESHPDLIGFQPRYQTLKLDVTDEATHEETGLTSKMSTGIDLLFVKVLSEKAHLLAQVGYSSTDFNDFEGPAGVTIDHVKETQMLLGIGFAYELTHSLHFDALAVTADRTFVIPVGVGTYELKGVRIPGAEINVSWDFLQGSSYVIGASAIGEYIAALEKDGIEYKSAIEPIGALYWTSRFGHDRVNYRLNLTFKNGHQHTNVSEQKEQATILGLMVFFPLGH